LICRVLIELCAAQFLLSPGIVPARCLALKTDPSGGGAFVEFDLRTPIEPLSFTYEHEPVRPDPVTSGLKEA